MAAVTIRYFAAARAAAGQATAMAEAATIGDLVAAVSADRPELGRVLGICTFLLDGERGDADTPLVDGAVVDALPPFAGG